MASLELNKYVEIKALLVCKTGLHIGGSENELGIGTADSPVIKDARGIPYIPGSSLKGKMRSLLEYKYNRISSTGGPCECGETINICPVCTIFGPHRKQNHDLGPTRIIVRDAYLSQKSLKEWEDAAKSGIDLTETKKETAINRKTGTAYGGSLRTQQRINAGTEFDLNIAVRIFKGDNEEKIVAYIKEAIGLLGKDYLGGSGTRGYGWVEIRNLQVT